MQITCGHDVTDGIIWPLEYPMITVMCRDCSEEYETIYNLNMLSELVDKNWEHVIKKHKKGSEVYNLVKNQKEINRKVIDILKKLVKDKNV